MPSYKSINGIWEPAHEKVAVTGKDGLPEIYDGDDRAAKEYISSEGGTVGQDAAQDPQVLQAARNMGFENVDKYLAHFAPSPKQVLETKTAQEEIVTHKPKRGRPSANTLGTKGGFYEDTSNPQKEFDKKT